jgi:membrane protease YdiL (CAAX protease family)
LATLPMLVMLAVLTRVDWQPIVRIREIVRGFARQMLLRASWLEICVLCGLAGIGEELLFRGVLQTLLAGWTNPFLGIAAASAVFGAVHFLTRTYFLLAVAVGCYFGWLYLATGSLTAPIVAHAAYDFVALVVVHRSLRRYVETDIGEFRNQATPNDSRP